jgi:hypothetical protein
MQTGNIPDTAPAHTLAWEILTWAEENIVQPDGENAGDPWVFTDEQIRFLAHFYALKPDGKWVYRTASLRRAKGWGKSPILAALSIIEFCGPCRFSHWAKFNEHCPTCGGLHKTTDKHPIGKPEYNPWIQIAATSLDQTVNTLDMVRGMLVASPLVQKLGLDIAKTVVQYKSGKPGKIEPVSANSVTLEGGRPTFSVLDETHLWMETNGGHKVARVIDRNISKNTGGRARYCESTNAYNPNQDSIAQRTHEAVLAFGDFPCDILYDCVEGPPLDNLSDTDALRAALVESYGDSSWVDIDNIISAIRDPRTPAGESYRFYLNNIMESADTWMPKASWEACRDDDDPILKKDQIAIGFDGSLYDDATALVGSRLRDGKLFVLGLWEKPDDAGDGWEVNVTEVDAVIHKAFKDYRVAWVYADPYYWQDIIDRWAMEYGDKIVFKFPTNRERVMCEAIERFHTGAVSQQLKHDGNRNLQRHVLNAVTTEVRNGYLISKERPKSKKKIDLAVAAILAYEARGDAIADGRLRRRGRAIGV